MPGRNGRLGRNGRITRETKNIEKLLKQHFPDHPKDYPPIAYRYNPVSIRVRLVHKSFDGKSLWDRDQMVLPIIETLPEKTQADLILMLLLSPSEARRRVGYQEFEMQGHPRRVGPSTSN
jgi:stress-induced morphogen